MAALCFKESKEEQYFGSSFWYFETPIQQKECIKWALKYEKDNAQVDPAKSNMGGYQSFSSDDFAELPFFETIKNTLYEFPSFMFDNWWLNINRKGDYNKVHTHPRSHISGVYYITDNYGALTFINPLQHNRLWENRIFGKPMELKVSAKPGDLILFPSDIPHFVDQHNTRNPRISISFNLYFEY